MFKVGDKVRCVANMGRKHRLKIGEVYEIASVEYDYTLNETYVCLKNDMTEYSASRFEKVEEDSDTSMFKIGDNVRVTNYSNKSYIGQRGVITAIKEGIYPIVVRLDNHGSHHFNSQQLTSDNSSNEAEELENTTRYKTNSGKQLFDIFEDDLLNYEELRGFYKANIYKYIHRYNEKNGIDDLNKVKVYLNQLIKLEEKHND